MPAVAPGSTRPFLLLATRAEDAVADSEYRQFLRFGELAPERLVRVRLESAPLAELLPGFDVHDYAGVIIGGSPFTTSDPAASKSAVQVRVERELGIVVGDILKYDIPFLGACFGIGTLGLRQGGTVDTTYGETTGAVEIALTPAGRDDPLLAGLPDRFQSFVGHKEALRETPPGAVLLASSATCPVQMFRVGQHQYATQFHPELDVPGIVERIYAYQDAGYFVPSTIPALVADVSRAEVVWSSEVLANFTARYGS